MFLSMLTMTMYTYTPPSHHSNSSTPLLRWVEGPSQTTPTFDPITLIPLISTMVIIFGESLENTTGADPCQIGEESLLFGSDLVLTAEVAWPGDSTEHLETFILSTTIGFVFRAAQLVPNSPQRESP